LGSELSLCVLEFSLEFYFSPKPFGFQTLTLSSAKSAFSVLVQVALKSFS